MVLTNCYEMNEAHPDTFEIPTAEEVFGIKPGDYCKLIFEGKERMWVKVTGREKGTLTGELDNNPIEVDMRFGDRVTFEPKHIASIMPE